MKLAVFNVENLFDRAKAMNGDTWEHGKATLEKFARLNELLGQVSYSTQSKTEMRKLMLQLGLEKNDKGPFVLLRRNRKGLLKRPRGGGLEILANGRADWVGSLELRVEAVDELAMRNTARVIKDVNADVLGVVEAESRPVLDDFSRTILPAVKGKRYENVMLIDGNDMRGIDVGLMTKKGFPIGNMRSHVSDKNSKGRNIFSRDCPEYEIETPNGNRLLVMINHLKSKGYGKTSVSDARRKAQAARIKEIYEERIKLGYKYIAVIGDLNDTPDSNPLSPLLAKTDLKEISALPNHEDGGRPGTYGSSTASKKFDYILLSPKLFAKGGKSGIWRKGMWPGVRPKKWDAYPEIKRKGQAASDHAALWVELNI